MGPSHLPVAIHEDTTLIQALWQLLRMYVSAARAEAWLWLDPMGHRYGWVCAAALGLSAVARALAGAHFSYQLVR